MNTSGFSNQGNKENFGFFLIAIAFSVFYIVLTRVDLVLSYWGIFLSLGSESMVKGYFIVSMVSFTLIILLSLLFLFSFFKRKKNTRYVFLTLVLAYLIIQAAIYIYGAYVVGVDVESLIPDYVGHLITEVILYLLIYTPYIFISRKSRGVFTIS